MYRILLVEDSANSVHDLLLSWRYNVHLVSDCKRVGQAVKHFKPRAIICNKQHKNPCHFYCSVFTQPIPVLVIEQGESIEQVVQFIKLGVHDFFSQPVDTEKFAASIKTAINKKLAHESNIQQLFKDQFYLPGLIGKSPVMMQVADKVKKAARNQSNVMIIGKTGTGKEMIARNIHDLSKRSAKPFSPVDCSVFCSNLLESELFGYEKGAFTGANQTKPGLLENADGGTVFLDEITELDYNLQSKLLRAIQDKSFRRIGGQKQINYNVRFVSATNRDPIEAIRDKELRNDLYFRLNVVTIEIPPLRERTGDIPLLVDYFIKTFNLKNRKKIQNVDKELLDFFKSYDWPGNVRELQNIIEQMSILSDDAHLSIKNLPKSMCQLIPEMNIDAMTELPFNEAKVKSLNQFCQAYFDRLLQECDGNISKVSRRSGISRKSIYHILSELDLR